MKNRFGPFLSPAIAAEFDAKNPGQRFPEFRTLTVEQIRAFHRALADRLGVERPSPLALSMSLYTRLSGREGGTLGSGGESSRAAAERLGGRLDDRVVIAFRGLEECHSIRFGDLGALIRCAERSGISLGDGFLAFAEDLRWAVSVEPDGAIEFIDLDAAA